MGKGFFLEISPVNFKVKIRITFRLEFFKILDSIIKWTQSESKFSMELNDLHLILFDSHSKTMAENFMNYKVPSIKLLESTQQNATTKKVHFI